MIAINDNINTNIFEKIQKMYDLLRDHYIHLQFKNFEPWKENGWLKDAYFVQLITERDFLDFLSCSDVTDEAKKYFSGLGEYQRWYLRTYTSKEIMQQAKRIYGQ